MIEKMKLIITPPKEGGGGTTLTDKELRELEKQRKERLRIQKNTSNQK